MLVVRPMTLADLPMAMRLKAQAGWNQREADWRRFLDMQPDGCFVGELDGAAVATTVACRFGDVAWLAMVLVESAVRGHGIGTAMVHHALDYLDRQGVCSVRLDATPLGQPVYEKLGFVREYSLTRYGGTLAATGKKSVPPTSERIRIARREDYDRLCAFDAAVVGADRSKFLLRLFEEQPENVLWIEDRGAVAGYATVRAGSDAIQIGPCVASADVGAGLLTAVGARHVGKAAFLDVADAHAAAGEVAASLGLKPQRALLRMCRGPATGEDAIRLWASSGPELG